MVSGRRNDGPDDQTTFCSGFAFRQLNTSRKIAMRSPFTRTVFSSLKSTNVMLSIRRVPIGSMSMVTVQIPRGHI